MRLKAHAKLNLFLNVHGLRSDGFHDLTSVFHAIDLADDVGVGSGRGVTMTMEVPGDVDDDANLAARALRGLGATELAVTITKRIPLAAGLGGGSSDAAAVLVGGRDALALSITDEELCDIGAGLGSDVPFFVAGAGSALVEGRGEKVSRLDHGHGLWFVIGLTFVPLSTADVYARWDGLERAESSPPVQPMIDALISGDVHGVGALLHNDLEPAAMAMVPGLASKKEVLLECGALGALVSGSGPTLFGVAAGPDHAQEMAEAVSGVFDRVHVVASSLQSIQRVR